MKPKTLFAAFALLLTVCTLILTGQQKTVIEIMGGQKAVIAVPEFRATGDAQKYMDVFNTTLWNDLDGSGVLKMAAKTFYPLDTPQQPNDFQPKPAGIGASLKDWSGPPVSANNMAFGYAGVSNGNLLVMGWLYNLSQSTPASAQVFGNRYLGAISEEGARDVAHRFAADILKQFGVKSLAGSQIIFVSDRTGPRKLPDGKTTVPVKEIWAMDYDGANQHQLTRYNTLSFTPAVSADGKLLAYTYYPPNDGNPVLKIQSLEDGRQSVYANFKSSILATPDFSPDGQHLYFSTVVDKDQQICVTDLKGGGFTRVSHVAAIETSPRVNPQNPNQILFISGRSGREQLWMMNANGGDLEMLTDGEGYVSNPAWRDDGKFIAFSWTKGYEIGQYNIFIMEMGTRQITQLTKGNASRNENPWWAPDGLHIVFASKPRGGRSQIHVMLADGTHQSPPLTTKGDNSQPVWVKGIN
ncbi:MAG TPA: hypothetical protein VGN17_15185 [Bryobacteraceae bacterium]|jgi:TolB protein